MNVKSGRPDRGRGGVGANLDVVGQGGEGGHFSAKISDVLYGSPLTDFGSHFCVGKIICRAFSKISTVFRSSVGITR